MSISSDWATSTPSPGGGDAGIASMPNRIWNWGGGCGVLDETEGSIRGGDLLGTSPSPRRLGEHGSAADAA
eukprot:2809627-Lingulodinium_polyedra.AAC.1